MQLLSRGYSLNCGDYKNTIPIKLFTQRNTLSITIVHILNVFTERIAVGDVLGLFLAYLRNALLLSLKALL